MAEQKEPQDADVQMPPPSEGIAAPRREKKKKGFQLTQGKVFMGGLAVMVLVAGFVLLRGDDGPPAPTQDEGASEFEAEVQEFQRLDESGGGVGQERAEVLAEIDEREELERRILSGKSAVRFGEPIDEDTDEVEAESAPPPPNVFGDVTPRQPPPPAPARQTPQAPAGSIGSLPPQARGGGGLSDSDMTRIQYELGLDAEATPGSTEIAYYQTSEADGGGRGSVSHRPLPIIPEVPRLGQRNGADAKQKAVVLPGEQTIAYMRNRISSDQPSGIVRIDILDGPLRGGHMLGKAAFEGERLIINFDQLVHDGEVIEGARAIAIDPNTLDTSVQDGVNRRLFLRYGVPVLTGIAAIGVDYQAHRQSPTVTETNHHTGELVSRRINQSESFGEYAMTEAADGLKTPLQAIATRAASTPIETWAEPGIIGLMFTSGVYK